MALWFADRPLVLASRSTVRRAILHDAGIPVEVDPADIDERVLEQQVDRPGRGDEIAAVLALAKARTVAARRPARLVLGADQSLTLGERRFSKPVDRAGAREQLAALSGRTHALHTAIALVRDGTTLFHHRETARLTMRAFGDDFIDRYLNEVGCAVTASVGGYQLEKIGIQLFEHVEGDHFVILGLPLLALLSYFRGAGLVAA
jgi:septum formation protein